MNGDEHEYEHEIEISRPAKRFKHTSYQASLKSVHAPTALSLLNQSSQQVSIDEEDVGEHDSHFHLALEQWQQLNLSPTLVEFTKKVGSMSGSMALLVHHWREIIELWMGVLEKSDQEGLTPLFDLLQKLVHDLRTTLSPVYLDLITSLAKFLSKSIPTNALTALFATFSTLFRILLVPSNDATVFEATWGYLQGVIPRCQGEIQRATGEMWSLVLRRLNSEMKKVVVGLMVKDLDGVEDMVSWAFVCACKSVSQTLHTATTSILNCLLDAYVKTQGEQKAPLFKVTKRTLTALVHHVKDAPQFESVAQALVQRLLSIDPNDENTLTRTLEVISIPLSVRKGARFSTQQLSSLFTYHPRIPLSSPAYAIYTTSLIMTGDMSLWMSSGRQTLERLWTENSSLAVRVSGALAELGWGGWKMIGLPLVMRNTGAGRQLDGDKVALVAELKREDRIGEVDLVWRRAVEGWCKGRLGGDKFSEEGATLDDVFTLSYYVPSILPGLVAMVEKLLAEPVDDYTVTPINSAWLLSSSLKVLGTSEDKRWRRDVDLTEWTKLVAKNWAWAEGVIGGLVVIIQSLPSETKETVRLEEVYPYFKSSLLSHSRPLRLHTLQLLGSNLVGCSQNDKDVIKRCLAGELVALDAQGVRERVLRIGRVGQIVNSGDGLGKDIVVRWLLGQLKVNLRPIWSPALAALASLSTHVGDVVWELAFGELSALCHGEIPGAVRPSWMENQEDEGDEDKEDEWEEEKSWRDPSAHKLRQQVRRWSDISRMRRMRIKEQQSTERFDLKSYENNVLSAFVESHALAEKHNRELVSLFLSLRDQMPRYKLVAWLGLFVKFNNPKAIHATVELHRLYLNLLSHPDRQTQKIALDCLFKYKDKRLQRYEDRIRLLLDDSRWRDELTLLDLDELAGEEREVVLGVVMRLLFGLMLERRGKGRGGDRRAAVLGALAACDGNELGVLVDLMLGPMGMGRDSGLDEGDMIKAASKQQVGFLVLLSDVMKNLGPQLLPYWPALVNTTIRICAQAQATLQASSSTSSVGEDEGGVEEVEEDDEEQNDQDPVKAHKTARSIRQLALKRLAAFFKCPVQFDFRPFMSTLFKKIISPRLSTLAVENTQAPSALLELFYVWSLRAEYSVFLWDYDKQVLPKIFECLVATSVKPEAILRIFDIIDHLLSLAEETEKSGIEKSVPLLLRNLSVLLEQKQDVAAVSTPLGQRLISILSRVAGYCTDASLARSLHKLLIPLLRKPFKVVSEKVKADLLKSLDGVMDLLSELRDSSTSLYQSTLDTFSRLFQALRLRNARLALVQAFMHLSRLQPELAELAVLMQGLNAYSTKRLDEPDFDTRLKAFTKLNDEMHISLPAPHWLPLVYNMLLFIQDPAELSIRTNAAHSLNLFIDLAAVSPASEYEVTFGRVVYPGLKKILKSKTENVRAEALAVVAHAVSKCDHIASLVEMRPLLAGGDEEASFFANIHHIQVHRRTRALRRLAEQCEPGVIRSSTTADVLLPLVGHFVTSSENLDHHLVNEAVVTTGKLSHHLSWGPYYALVQKYLKLSKDKQHSEKVYVRTLLAILDNFHFAMDTVVEEVEGDKNEDEDEEPQEDPVAVAKKTSKITDAVNLRLLPSLLSHLEKHDASTEDSTRIPIAVGIIQVAQFLPPDARSTQVSRLLTVLSQIFRSKSQETRDLARDTLCRIAVILGPMQLPNILRELRGALTRGPQLHVLGHLTHHLLVHLTSGEHASSFTVLDASVEDIVHVSAEVIFGESGKDVRSEGFKTKMREVRSSSSKGLDSFSITSKFITPSYIGPLLSPIRAIMYETETEKTMGLVDEVLKRIASGLNSNEHLVPTELLVLCHTLISQNAKFLKQAPVRTKKVKGDAIVQLKRTLAAETDHYSANSYRFVVLGLDLLQTALRRNRFDFKDTLVMSRLDSLVTVIGNTLYSSSAAILTLGLKVAALLCKCPLPSLAKSLPVIVRQTLDIVKQVGNTDSEIVQTAFKSLAVILRDAPTTEIKEKDLVYLLELLSPDLEDPSRQATVFTLLRAIVGRKFVVPEIYDLMDRVAEIMVTSQSPQVQEMSRSVLLQFLLDYPQGKGRLRKQMAFLVKNLTYVYESGRKSVLELLGAIITKFNDTLIREYADAIFVGLVMAMVNDDSPQCKEMAARLVKSLLTRLDEDGISAVMSLTNSWATHQDQASLNWVAFHVYGLVAESLSAPADQYIPNVFETTSTRLRQSMELLDDKDDIDTEEDNDTTMWQVPYYALVALSKLFTASPDRVKEFNLLPWEAVRAHLTHPHSWVRIAASRLFGVLYTAVPPEESADSDDSPLSPPFIQETAKRFCVQLKSEHLDEHLALQIVKNLLYIAKRFAYHGQMTTQGQEPDEENEGDCVDNGALSKKTALSWIFSRLSFQLRSAQTARRSRKVTNPNWYHQPTSILQLFAAITSFLSPESAELYLPHMLSPIYRITDDDTIHDAKMADLKVLAIEVQDLVQAKVGVTKFSSVYNEIRQGVLTTRQERKTANALQAIANPEVAAKRKLRKNAIKKESRKRKNIAFADSRGRLKRHRDGE